MERNRWLVVALLVAACVVCAAVREGTYTRCKLVVKGTHPDPNGIHVKLTCKNGTNSEEVVLIDEGTPLWDVDRTKFVAEGTPLTFFDDLREFRSIAQISDYLEAEPFELYDSEFHNLLAFAEGIPFIAPLTIQSSRVKLTNCSFVGNSAGISGAIALSGEGYVLPHSEREKSSPLLVIDRCLFESGRGYAGAIAADDFPGITITNSSFVSNEGYALRKTGSGGSILIQGCIFNGNASFTQRGVLRGVDGGTVTITGSTFENHWSRRGSVFFWETKGTESPDILIEKSSFHKNIGVYGGVLASAGNAVVRIRSCIFGNNYAYEGGGVLHFKPASSGNFSLAVATSAFTSNGASRLGGVISVKARKAWFAWWDTDKGRAGDVYLTDNEFVDNKADRGEGGVASIHGVGQLSLTVSQGAFLNNSALTNGGALALWGLKSVIVEEADFVGNKVVGRRDPIGGAIHGGDISTMSVEGVVFRRNLAGSRHRQGFGPRSYGGGAVAMESSSSHKGGQQLAIKSCQFVGNFASVEGGAIFIYSYKHGTVFLEDLKIFHSNAGGGGAVSINIAKSVAIRDSFLAGNEASRWEGGAVHACHVENLNVLNTNFGENKALGKFGEGGAIGIKHVKKSSFGNCGFCNNTANRQGGALASSTVKDTLVWASHFSDNAAITGGGVMLFGQQHKPDMTLEIRESEFKNNTATKSSGGAVEAQFMDEVDILRCSFETNTAADFGGSVSLRHVYNGSMESCEFNQSFAGSSGGGVAFSNSMFAEVKECGFYRNQAVVEGTAIFASGHQLEVVRVSAVGQQGVSSLAAEEMGVKIIDSTFSTSEPTLSEGMKIIQES